MLDILVQIIISWLLLWIVCKQNLLVLGIKPSGKRLNHFFFGFVTAAVCCTLYYLSFIAFTSNKWVLNKQFTATAFWEGAWYTIKSVFYEELLFRGALLYILIRKTGSRMACIVSAIAFGIYHWFTTGALGNPAQMIFIFLLTGFWGYMFAMTFAKTCSLYLPVGLHLGWNLVNTVVFSQGPLGKQLLIGNGQETLGIALSIVVFLFQLFAVPVIIWWYLKRLKTNEWQGMVRTEQAVPAG